MKHIISFIAIAALCAAVCLNANAKSPRRVLVGTEWVGPAWIDAREDAPADPEINYHLLLSFGPGGMVNAQYCETRGSHRSATPLGPVWPLKYKIRQAHNDGSIDIVLKGRIKDGSSAIYKTKPHRWLTTATGTVDGDSLECGLGTFTRIE